MRTRFLLLLGSSLAVANVACSSTDSSPTNANVPSTSSTSGNASSSASTSASSAASSSMVAASSGASTAASGGSGGAGGATAGAGGSGGAAAGGAGGTTPIESTKHVLLISVDGLHQVDLANWITGHATSTLAKLAGTGVEYTAAHTTTPSDSFPGLLALVTGGTPKTTGVYYDDSYDRTLYAPGSKCAGNPGTEVVFDESVEYDDSKLFSGGINADNLPYTKTVNGNCKPVYPHDFVRVNTIFEVIRAEGGYTAWSDKHAAYDLVNGPSGQGVEDLYTPEVNSLIANGGTANGINLGATLALCDGTTNSLPTAKVTDYTTCEPAIKAYDDVKVQAIINQIDGKLSDGSAAAPVPTIFGMNFQQISVTQKLPVGGYKDAAGTPSVLLADALNHVDVSLGKMVAELQAKNLLDSTLIIISAKHGQSPVDPTQLHMESGGEGTADVTDPLPTINTVDATVENQFSTFMNPNSGNAYVTHGHFQTDDVGLLWLQDQTKAAAIVTALQANAAAIHADTLPPGTVFTTSITSGAPLTAMFGDPTSTDPVASARAPNAFIQPNLGVIYSGSSKKISEHGGGQATDTGVALLISLPSFGSQKTISTPVATTQVAPTILKALGIDPTKLQAVVKESTAELPGLF